MTELGEMQVRELQALLDKQEIYEALARYCRGIDRCDERLVLSAFHDDAFDEHGSFRRLVRDFARDIVQQKLDEVAFSVHRITNHLVEFVNSDTAVSEAYVMSVQRLNDDTFTQFSWDRYIDRFERRDGIWRSAYRLLLHDSHGSMELDGWRMTAIDPESFTKSARDTTDPVIGGRSLLFPPLAAS